MKFAVYFADNDFVNTLLPFFKYLHDYLEYFNPEKLTKQNLKRLILECLPAFYLLRQKCAFDVDFHDLESLKGYFRSELRIENIYIGDEVDLFLQSKNISGGSEVYVIYNEHCYTV